MPERQHTLLLYLNDLGGGGGGTNFPLLNISVEPRCGRGLAWTNHHAAADGGGPDERLMHESAAVTAGVKYCMNIWVRAWGRSTSAPGFPRICTGAGAHLQRDRPEASVNRINCGAAQVMDLPWLPHQAHRYRRATFGRANPLILPCVRGAQHVRARTRMQSRSRAPATRSRTASKRTQPKSGSGGVSLWSAGAFARQCSLLQRSATLCAARQAAAVCFCFRRHMGCVCDARRMGHGSRSLCLMLCRN